MGRSTPLDNDSGTGLRCEAGHDRCELQTRFRGHGIIECIKPVNTFILCIMIPNLQTKKIQINAKSELQI